MPTTFADPGLTSELSSLSWMNEPFAGCEYVDRKIAARNMVKSLTSSTLLGKIELIWRLGWIQPATRSLNTQSRNGGKDAPTGRSLVRCCVQLIVQNSNSRNKIKNQKWESHKHIKTYNKPWIIKNECSKPFQPQNSTHTFWHQKHSRTLTTTIAKQFYFETEWMIFAWRTKR